MSDTSLAICIPTYNRAEILRATLRHLAELSGDIAEIVITDNASEDHTRDVVEESRQYFQRLFYHRHDENLGSWRNIHSALSVSRCKYQYLLSDDDRVIMNGIKKGISILEGDPSSVAVCGGYKDIDENGDLRLEMISGYPNRKFEKKDKIDLFNSFYYIWHPIFLTESYQRYCFNDGLSMGFWALMDQMLNAGSIWVIPEFFYEHYATEGRLEQSITEPWYQEFHKADVEVFLGQLKPDISQLPNIAELVTRRHKHVQQFAMTAAKEKGDAVGERFYLLRQRAYGWRSIAYERDWEERCLVRCAFDRIIERLRVGNYDTIVIQINEMNIGVIAEKISTIFPDIQIIKMETAEFVMLPSSPKSVFLAEEWAIFDLRAELGVSDSGAARIAFLDLLQLFKLSDSVGPRVLRGPDGSEHRVVL